MRPRIFTPRAHAQIIEPIALTPGGSMKFGYSIFTWGTARTCVQALVRGPGDYLVTFWLDGAATVAHTNERAKAEKAAKLFLHPPGFVDAAAAPLVANPPSPESLREAIALLGPQ